MLGLLLILVFCGTHLRVGECSNVDRIYGGDPAKIEDYPYMVSFIVNKTYFCGGFIISEYYIATAAHCTEKANPSEVVLHAGSSDRTKGIVMPVAQVYAHPQYGHPEFDKDIGVIKTVNPIKFTDVIKPVKLPAKGFKLKDGSKVVITGWGITNEGSNIPEQLMTATIPVIDIWRCRIVYPTVLTENMFCGGDLIVRSPESCSGDSGGPAVQNGVAVGITSFGRGCGNLMSPAVYALVSAPTIRDFITNITGI